MMLNYHLTRSEACECLESKQVLCPSGVPQKSKEILKIFFCLVVRFIRKNYKEEVPPVKYKNILNLPHPIQN